MERQALEIAGWGCHVVVNIPITNTRGEFSGALVRRLARAGVKRNVTALMTLDQVRVQGTIGTVTGVAFAAQLDPIAEARRYLSGHRLVWRIGDRLTVGGSEVVLYGGPDRPPE